MDDSDMFEQPDGFIGFSKTATLHMCQPVRHGGENGPPATRIVFATKVLPFVPPLSLDLNNSRRLAAALIYVLAYFEDPIAMKLQSLVAGDDLWARASASPVAFSEKKRWMLPSRSQNCPQHPISENELWQLICLVRNCADHDLFLKFLGVTDAGPQE